MRHYSLLSELTSVIFVSAGKLLLLFQMGFRENSGIAELDFKPSCIGVRNAKVDLFTFKNPRSGFQSMLSGRQQQSEFLSVIDASGGMSVEKNPDAHSKWQPAFLSFDDDSRHILSFSDQRQNIFTASSHARQE